ncbi:MAG: hypothetical protein V3W04_15990 [Gammaproteobacteria bacterium]
MKKVRDLLLGWMFMSMLSSCSALPTPHENFKNIMQSNIGKRESDPSSYLSRYPQRVFDSKHLPNGNTETEYRRSEKCRVFFEIELDSRIIVGWRFEGNEKDCDIVP